MIFAKLRIKSDKSVVLLYLFVLVGVSCRSLLRRADVVSANETYGWLCGTLTSLLTEG